MIWRFWPPMAIKLARMRMGTRLMRHRIYPCIWRAGARRKPTKRMIHVLDKFRIFIQTDIYASGPRRPKRPKFKPNMMRRSRNYPPYHYGRMHRTRAHAQSVATDAPSTVVNKNNSNLYRAHRACIRAARTCVSTFALKLVFMFAINIATITHMCHQCATNVRPPHGVTTLVAYTQKDNQRKISAHLLRTDHQSLSLTMRPYGPCDAHPQVCRVLLPENSNFYPSKNVHSCH